MDECQSDRHTETSCFRGGHRQLLNLLLHQVQSLGGRWVEDLERRVGFQIETSRLGSWWQ